MQYSEMQQLWIFRIQRAEPDQPVSLWKDWAGLHALVLEWKQILYLCLYHQPLAHVLLQQDAATDRCRRSSYSKSLMHSVFQAHQSRRVRSLLTWFCREALHDGAVPLPVSLTFWSSCSSAWLSFPVRGNWVIAALLGLRKPHDAFVFWPVITIDFGFSVLIVFGHASVVFIPWRAVRLKSHPQFLQSL